MLVNVSINFASTLQRGFEWLKKQKVFTHFGSFGAFSCASVLLFVFIYFFVRIRILKIDEAVPSPTSPLYPRQCSNLYRQNQQKGFFPLGTPQFYLIYHKVHSSHFCKFFNQLTEASSTALSHYRSYMPFWRARCSIVYGFRGCSLYLNQRHTEVMIMKISTGSSRMYELYQLEKVRPTWVFCFWFLRCVLR